MGDDDRDHYHRDQFFFLELSSGLCASAPELAYQVSTPFVGGDKCVGCGGDEACGVAQIFMRLDFACAVALSFALLIMNDLVVVTFITKPAMRIFSIIFSIMPLFLSSMTVYAISNTRIFFGEVDNVEDHMWDGGCEVRAFPDISFYAISLSIVGYLFMACTIVRPYCRYVATAVDAASKEGKTDVFLTHDWGEDEFGRDNHFRVGKVNNYLKTKGIITWFDAERMSGNIRRKMAVGIENASLVLVFVTERYRNKVNGTEDRDNCRYEFGFSVRQKGPQRMIPIVMEKRMRASSSWGGELGAELGGKLYIGMVDDDNVVFYNRCEDLYHTIVNIIGEEGLQCAIMAPPRGESNKIRPLEGLSLANT